MSSIVEVASFMETEHAIVFLRTDDGEVHALEYGIPAHLQDHQHQLQQDHLPSNGGGGGSSISAAQKKKRHYDKTVEKHSQMKQNNSKQKFGNGSNLKNGSGGGGGGAEAYNVHLWSPLSVRPNEIANTNKKNRAKPLPLPPQSEWHAVKPVAHDATPPTGGGGKQRRGSNSSSTGSGNFSLFTPETLNHDLKHEWHHHHNSATSEVGGFRDEKSFVRHIVVDKLNAC